MSREITNDLVLKNLHGPSKFHKCKTEEFLDVLALTGMVQFHYI